MGFYISTINNSPHIYVKKYAFANHEYDNSDGEFILVSVGELI